MTTFTATYSAEDNKLRLYASDRLDADLYARVKEAGFKWAPKQELFVAPKWTPSREDLCIELAEDGEITAEESTMIERAEAKAARLEGIAQRRGQQANAFFDAASKIAERFAYGQPILVGHHSERGARKDQERMKSAMDKSVKLQKSIQYWNWKAEGVEHHANQKANPRTRANRIKGLLKDLRDFQRNINHAQICVKLWQRVELLEGDNFTTAVERYVGSQIPTGSPAGYKDYSNLSDGKVEHRALVESLIQRWNNVMHSEHNQRWMSHILNRLAYERDEQGAVGRFDGDLTPVIIQAFAREHGAHKPKATKTENGFTLESSVDLPAHIATGATLTLDADGWRDLMQASGYTVVIAEKRKSTKPKAPPLINPTQEEAERLQAIWNEKAKAKYLANHYGDLKCNDVLPFTQAEYSDRSGGSYSSAKTIELDANGVQIWSSYKGKSAEPVCRIRVFTKGAIYAPVAIVVITDKPQKSLPITFNIVTEDEVA